MDLFDIDDIDFMLSIISYLIDNYNWSIDESWRKLKACGFLYKLQFQTGYVYHYDAGYWGEYIRNYIGDSK